MKTRGLRNNNPLNIRKSSTKWIGEIQPSKDASFKQFSNMAYGYRAAMVTLRTYYNKHGIKTLNGMIQRWAPEIENNTQSYINTVSKRSGIAPTAAINVSDRNMMCAMVAAMSYVENGIDASMVDVYKGWKLL